MADTKEKKMKTWKEFSKKQKGLVIGAASAIILGAAGAITAVVLKNKNKNNKDVDDDVTEVVVEA